ncbi:hypothetical protein OG900_37345 [Streptomyces sp. NBC_00433]
MSREYNNPYANWREDGARDIHAKMAALPDVRGTGTQLAPYLTDGSGRLHVFGIGLDSDQTGS